jgi:hypothetical protein
MSNKQIDIEPAEVRQGIRRRVPENDVLFDLRAELVLPKQISPVHVSASMHFSDRLHGDVRIVFVRLEGKRAPRQTGHEFV